jgi:GNAT superfamily N-acetyltransferase
MKTQLGHEEAAMACSVDYHDRMAFAVFKRFEREAEKIVGIGRYDLNHRTNMAETAFVVHEDFRGIGIGTYLLDRIIEYAKAQGIAGIQSEVLASNRPALDMHERLGHKMEYDEEDKIYRIEHRWDKQRPPRRGREPHERASR